jgi:hypothetical protein
MSRAQRRDAILASWGLRRRPEQPVPQNLEIVEEARPYHLGWILYARSLLRDW